MEEMAKAMMEDGWKSAGKAKWEEWQCLQSFADVGSEEESSVEDAPQ